MIVVTTICIKWTAGLRIIVYDVLQVEKGVGLVIIVALRRRKCTQIYVLT